MFLKILSTKPKHNDPDTSIVFLGDNEIGWLCQKYRMNPDKVDKDGVVLSIKPFIPIYLEDKLRFDSQIDALSHLEEKIKEAVKFLTQNDIP